MCIDELIDYLNQWPGYSNVTIVDNRFLEVTTEDGELLGTVDLKGGF